MDVSCPFGFSFPFPAPFGVGASEPEVDISVHRLLGGRIGAEDLVSSVVEGCDETGPFSRTLSRLSAGWTGSSVPLEIED